MSIKNQIIKIILIIAPFVIIYYLIIYSIPYIAEILPKNYENLLISNQNIISEILEAIIVFILGYLIINIIRNLIYSKSLSMLEKRTAHILKFTIDVMLYLILILIILSILHINLTGLVVGGALTGIIIGLALQTVMQNLLSGALVSYSKTINEGDIIVFISWIWGNPVIGEVKKVSLLFTEVLTIYGNLIKIPNSAFLGNTIFQKLDKCDNKYLYPLQITVNGDVEGYKIIDNVKEKIKDNRILDIIFSNKDGTTNIFTVNLQFSNLNELKELIDIVNRNFDEAYWELKNKI